MLFRSDSTRNPSVGGNLVNFPRRAITLGMKQCLQARRMLLMTRNETKTFLWSNTVLRIAALGAPGDDYPVTQARNHKNLTIVSERASAQKRSEKGGVGKGGGCAREKEEVKGEGNP